MGKFLVLVHDMETGTVIHQFVTEAKDSVDAVKQYAEHVTDDLRQDIVALAVSEGTKATKKSDPEPEGKVHGS
jgi:hypothetical protein